MRARTRLAIDSIDQGMLALSIRRDRSRGGRTLAKAEAYGTDMPQARAEGRRLGTDPARSETYAHLGASRVDDALRRPGDCLLTKLRSSPQLIEKSERAGCVFGTQNDILLEAIKKRHSLEQSGDWGGVR